MFVFENLMTSTTAASRPCCAKCRATRWSLPQGRAARDAWEKIFKNMSQRKRRNAPRDPESRGPVRPSEVEAEHEIKTAPPSGRGRPDCAVQRGGDDAS